MENSLLKPEIGRYIVDIHISYSLLEEFLSCNRKVYYRTHRPEDGVQNKEMIVGEIVHSAIEKHWSDRHLAYSYVTSQMDKRLNGDAESFLYAKKCLMSFFDNFAGYLSSEDKIECKFRIPFEKGVLIVGKMDRVTNDKVFDWKTNKRPPSSINNNMQFMIYAWAYKKMYNKNPSGVYYASLSTGSLIRLSENLQLHNALFDEVIPSLVSAIKTKDFNRNGIFRKSCFRCQYSNTCLKEVKHELDR